MSSSLLLTEYYITEQSWVFLINVSSGVYLQIAGQQWAGPEIDWNISEIGLKSSTKSYIKDKTDSNFTFSQVLTQSYGNTWCLNLFKKYL